MQAVEQAQQAMEQIDMKKVSNKVQQSIQFIKKKMENLKKSTKNNELAITVNNKEASKQISQIEREIESLQKKITGRQLKLDITNNTLDKMRADTNQAVINEMPEAGNRKIKAETYKRLDNNSEYTSLVSESDKLNKQIEKYNALLAMAKQKLGELGQKTNQTATTQNKMGSFFNGFKGKLEQAKISVTGLKNNFNQLPKITQNITNNIKNMAGKMKQGIGHVLKYATALFSLRSIYSTLSSSAQNWLGSQNVQAKQLSANIEYMKYSMGSVFAPVIEYITNLVYNLMKAVQSLVYAFSGVNIFAKATASSMGKTAGSASKASKSLTGVHNEINNVSDQDSSSGSGTVAPNMDLSQIDTQLSPLAQKLYDFFKPLKESWDNYGTSLIEQLKTTASQVGGLISSVWGSFENIITNGTVYTILENILAIIGNVAEAFANAWNYNGNGDAIVQNLADAFSNLLIIINNIVSSSIFQWLLNIGVSAIKVATDAIKTLSDAVLWVSEKIGEFIGVFTGENSEKLDGWAIILGSIATAIALVVAAVTAWNVISAIATVATTAFGIAVNILTSPITLVILAIAALIAIIVAIVVYWDEISAALAEGWEWIKQKAEEIWNAIADFFQNLWQGICDVAKNIWNGIKDFFSGLWEGIKNAVMTVWNAIKDFFVNYFNTVKGIFENIWNGISTFVSNIFNSIKNTISNVLNGIKTIWNNIWNGLKITVTNIFNGIWNTIKKVINSILGGIEGMANGVINGVNGMIRVLNKLKFDIPDWVPGFGGKTFGLNLSTLNTISLPRLAKGGIIDSPTVALMGEYSNARSNPEIATPQNIMRETFEDVLSDFSFNNNSQNLELSVYVGNERLGKILLDDLRNMKRQTGKGIEALVN